jgi:hypothetical protein
VLAAIVAAVLALVSSGDGPAQSFYGTAAAIIPVLMVALAVEGRAADAFEGESGNAYRVLLFVFLLMGETCALLGASGIFRGHIHAASTMFQGGAVAESHALVSVIAAGTGAGLVGGFVMIAVLAVGGPGSVTTSVRRRAAHAERTHQP